MSVVIIGIFGAMMIGAAIFAVYSRSILSAIISSGVISLLASIIYILLAAPDVAMTEAAIGSGLTTVVFLLALRRIYAYAGAAGPDSAGPNAAGSRSAEEAIDD
ncbi:MAG: Na(+)/H(+) antiporter subunit B [Spirochaetota bacterium]